MTDTEVEHKRDLICTAPNDCYNETFEVVDNRDDEQLEITCTSCGNTQVWDLNRRQ